MAVISAIGILLLMPLAMMVPKPEWTLALLAPALFFDALAMGTAAAALQHIFPNQVRGQVSALYLFILNLGGGSLGPLLPGVFNDYYSTIPIWWDIRWRLPSPSGPLGC